jgi:nucleotide-binding universal stress UspA family protein
MNVLQITGANMYGRILVAIDASDSSQRALEHALQLAAEQQARLRIVHAIESIEHLAMAFSGGYPVDMTEFMEAQRQEGQRLLTEAQTRAHSAKIDSEIALLEGKNAMDRTARLVVKEAKKWDADLIVIGSHGKTGLDRLVLGSVAESVIRTAQRPVLMIHAH